MPSSARASLYSHTNSMHSMCSQVESRVRHIAHYGQPTIEIRLNGHQGPRSTWVTSYSNMDTVEGTVAITAAHDTRFEDIDIVFVGSSQTFVDRLTTSPTMTGRTEAHQRFLVLRQPMDEADFPSPRIFEAGRTYQFPFTFTIPSHLLPRACTHKVSSDHVRDCHLMLPPSLGDPDLAGHGSTLLDDLAPDMSRIVYAVKARIAQQNCSDGVSILAEKSKKVRVKPSFIEQPPLNIDGNTEFRPWQQKSVRKSLFKGKSGTLSAQTLQPKPLVIPGARTSDPKPITTMAKLLLRFDPLDENNAPPKLGSLATKLKVTTWYSSAPRHSFPSRSSLGYDITQGAFSENIALSSLCIAAAQWEKQDSTTSRKAEDSAIRRDSGISDCSAYDSAEAALAVGILPASTEYKNGTFYTAQILVPVTLPSTKNFIPTFHSCLISRTYALNLQFAAHGGSSMTLKVPIQICANGSDSGIENARARSVEQTQLREAADVWAPRSVAPPSFDDIDTTTHVNTVAPMDELPPDYTTFAPSSRRHRSSIAV